MKKFIYVFMIMALLAFAGCAFAAGHGSIDPNYESIEVSSEDVEVPEGVTVDGCGTITSADAKNDIAAIGSIAKGDAQILGGFTLNLGGDKGDEPVDITIDNVDISGNINYSYIGKAGKFGEYQATLSGKKLTIKNVPLKDHFSEASIYLASVTTSSGGSSGGCNAGFAALLLLAATPLCFFRKK